MSEKSSEDFINDCRKLVSKYGKNLGDLKYQIEQLDFEDAQLQIVKTSLMNKDLVGRFFRTLSTENQEGVTYLKVLSERSMTSSSVECLVFDTPPKLCFTPQLSMKRQPGDGYLGEFDFNGIYTDDYMANDIRGMEEVSEEEFRNALKEYVSQLLDTEPSGL